MKESTNIEADSDVSLEIPPETVIAYSIRELKIRKDGQYGEHNDFFFFKKVKYAFLIFKIFTLNVESGNCHHCLNSGVHLRCCMCRYRPATGHHRGHRVRLTRTFCLGVPECCGWRLPGRNAVFGHAVEWFVPFSFFPCVSWPSFLTVLGSETQWRSEKTFSLNRHLMRTDKKKQITDYYLTVN